MSQVGNTMVTRSGWRYRASKPDSSEGLLVIEENKGREKNNQTDNQPSMTSIGRLDSYGKGWLVLRISARCSKSGVIPAWLIGAAIFGVCCLLCLLSCCQQSSQLSRNKHPQPGPGTRTANIRYVRSPIWTARAIRRRQGSESHRQKAGC